MTEINFFSFFFLSPATVGPCLIVNVRMISFSSKYSSFSNYIVPSFLATISLLLHSLVPFWEHSPIWIFFVNVSLSLTLVIPVIMRSSFTCVKALTVCFRSITLLKNPLCQPVFIHSSQVHIEGQSSFSNGICESVYMEVVVYSSITSNTHQFSTVQLPV